VGDGKQYRFTWGSGNAPIAAGDRVELRAGASTWDCNLGQLFYVPGHSNARIPCPGYYPPLTTRVTSQ
jgi:hypothetical protein